MISKILAIITTALIAFVLYVATRPGDFVISRTTTISALPEKIFSHVNNLKAWDDWSPWIQLDPDAKHSLEGPENGVGAVSNWSGNNQVGQGSMTIVESRPNEYIKLRLDFLRPMQTTNTAEFTFVAKGNETSVTWSMSGKNNFIGKAMSVVFNCDKMVGGQFEKGLNNLKKIIETR